MSSGVEPSDPPSLCPVCSAKSARFEVGQTELFVCGACTHVFRGPGTQGDNKLFESEEYVAWRAGSIEQTRIADRRISLLDEFDLPRGRSLEIGCATGEAVGALLSRGWDAYGIDVSEYAVRAGKRLIGEDRLAVGLSPGIADHKFDLLLAFHVLEHVPDIRDFGGMLRRRSLPNSYLYVRVPNWNSWSRKVSGRYWPSLMPEHLHHFTEVSIWTWLHSIGYTPVWVGTEGRGREWLGALRRCIARDKSVGSTSEIAATTRRLEVIDKVERWGRPWFHLEERVNRGSELVAIAQRDPH
ncbi:MAG: class I SAM-dependent methyltransferase [Microthrixaceae bacterium]|nr:class I SAM-dependent methyltransferase [Microthrixaceae bacterium]